MSLGIGVLALACVLALIAILTLCLREPTVTAVKMDDLTERYGGIIERHGPNELRLKKIDGVEVWRLVDDFGTILLECEYRPAASEISFAAYAARVGYDRARAEFG